MIVGEVVSPGGGGVEANGLVRRGFCVGRGTVPWLLESGRGEW